MVISVTIGSLIGGYAPVLLGNSDIFLSIIMGGVGGIVGIWAGWKYIKYMEG